MNKVLLSDLEFDGQGSSSFEYAFLYLQLPTPGSVAGREIECSEETLNEIVADGWDVDQWLPRHGDWLLVILKKRWR